MIAGIFVSGGPKDHLRENRSEVHTFGGEEIVQFTAIGGIGSRGDYAVGLQAAQTVGENVTGDALAGGKEFLEGAVATDHDVADDEQGPAVAEHFDGGVERTPGAAVGGGLFPCHLGRVQFSLAFCKRGGQDWRQ